MISDDPIAPKSYLIANIREALAQDPRVSDLNITVSVTGDRIFLSGIVATQERHDAISNVMSESFPGLDCYNETKVGIYPETHEVERLS